ncbi:MAG: KpsF/GutQ family sugar-phosphate isomerase [Bdellovibrionales bacterium]|nr:KpsF/GutQ family sugar-phosphate isomerase [Bdellovibrionales bacterium]
MAPNLSDLDEAKRVLEVEANSILHLRERLGEEFSNGVELVLACNGRVITSGIGKSGIIARKMASTFTSTGTPSFFLHPAESSHGDMGVVTKDDLVVAISYGGDSGELAPILSYCARKGIPVLALTGKPESALGRAGKVTLDISVSEEACPLGLAPTASTTVTLALADALAMAVLKRRGFEKEHFAEFHPGGSLGRRLLTRVKDVMHVGDALPLVRPGDEMSRVVSLMTAKDVRGVAGVLGDDGSLLGIITDGDIRRRLEKSNTPLVEKAEALMSRHPKTISADELAEKALFVMEQFQIQTLFVVDSGSDNPNRPVGLIHLQDLLRSNIR